MGFGRVSGLARSLIFLDCGFDPRTKVACRIKTHGNLSVLRGASRATPPLAAARNFLHSHRTKPVLLVAMSHGSSASWRQVLRTPPLRSARRRCTRLLQSTVLRQKAAIGAAEN